MDLTFSEVRTQVETRRKRCSSPRIGDPSHHSIVMPRYFGPQAGWLAGQRLLWDTGHSSAGCEVVRTVRISEGVLMLPFSPTFINSVDVVHCIPHCCSASCGKRVACAGQRAPEFQRSRGQSTDARGGDADGGMMVVEFSVPKVDSREIALA